MIRKIVIPQMNEKEMQKVRDYYKNTPNGYNAFQITSTEITPADLSVTASILLINYEYRNTVFEFLSPSCSVSERADLRKTQEGLVDLLSKLLKDSL